MAKEAMQTGSVVRNRNASEIRVRTIPTRAPFEWLAAGWKDLWSAPGIGLAYGVTFAILACAITAALQHFGKQSLILALGGGFLLIGPLVAVGLYEASRRLESGEPVTLAAVLQGSNRAPFQLACFGAILALAYALWLQLAFMLFALFMGGRELPSASEFVPQLLFTSHGLGLLVVGTTVGGVIAGLVFTVSAISVPLMMMRQIDVVSAMAASAEAVVLNLKPMALWAALVASIIMLGISTLCVGLVIAFPLIGHASWHAFRSLVQGRAVRDAGQ